MMYVEFMKNFLLAIRASGWLLDSFWLPEPKNVWSYFLDMMYVEFMKTFLLADSSERMAVRLILASWAQKRLMLLSRHDVRRVHEKFSSRRFERADGCKSHFGLLSPKTFDSYFLDLMYVEFMKNFLVADSTELLAVRLILLSWDKNVWFPLSRHNVCRSHQKFSSRRLELVKGC